MKRQALRTLLVMMAVGVLVYSGYQVYWWYFQHLNSNFNELVYTKDYKIRSNIDVLAARTALHKMLAWPYYGHHDAFLFAASLGDYSTVPLLIEDLKHQQWTKPGESMDCKKLHCIHAIERLTGTQGGDNYEDWIKWWNENGQHSKPQESRLTIPIHPTR